MAATERDVQVTAGWLVHATLAILVRPSLWLTAVRQVFVLAVPGWWRRRPYLPLPDPAYLAFRFRTAYGDTAQGPGSADVVTYLHWCRAWPHFSR